MNKVAEDERLARVKIEEKLADRHLTNEQQLRIANELKKFTGQAFSVFSLSGEGEIERFTREILQMLTSPQGPGWMLGGFTFGTEPYGRTIPGILIEVSKGADRRSVLAAKALVSALKDERLDAIGPYKRNDRDGSFIGLRQIIPGVPAIDDSVPITVTIGKKP